MAKEDTTIKVAQRYDPPLDGSFKPHVRGKFAFQVISEVLSTDTPLTTMKVCLKVGVCANHDTYYYWKRPHKVGELDGYDAVVEGYLEEMSTQGLVKVEQLPKTKQWTLTTDEERKKFVAEKKRRARAKAAANALGARFDATNVRVIFEGESLDNLIVLASNGVGAEQPPRLLTGELPEELTTALRLRDVVTYFHGVGYTTQEELLEQCLAVRDKVPVLARMNDPQARLERAMNVMGIPIQAQKKTKPTQAQSTV